MSGATEPSDSHGEFQTEAALTLKTSADNASAMRTLLASITRAACFSKSLLQKKKQEKTTETTKKRKLTRSSVECRTAFVSPSKPFSLLPGTVFGMDWAS